ncbi:MAG: hypothetical protein ACW99R_00710 [Candidatus Hodarchaeales archaeon]|jgi:hypothetical protein
MQEAERERNEILNSYEVTPRKYTELVTATLEGIPRNFFLQQKTLSGQLQNQPYVDVISILEKDQPLAALSRQIFLTEVIEKLTGQFIPKKMVLYRGYLLNWEKVFMIFSFFSNIAQIFSISDLHKTANRGFTSVQDTFENLWGSRFPINVMRPGIALKILDHNSIPIAIRSINIQRQVAKKILKIIEKSNTLSKSLHNLKFLSNSELGNTSLAGPIARASGIINPLIDLPTSKMQKTSLFYSQFAYGKAPSPLRFMEICYRELSLALERMTFLLPKFQGRLKDSTLPENSGQHSASYPITFGVNHLTIELSGDKAKYVNFIPFEYGNIEGISLLITINSDALTPYLLSYLNPELSFA